MPQYVVTRSLEEKSPPRFGHIAVFDGDPRSTRKIDADPSPVARYIVTGAIKSDSIRVDSNLPVVVRFQIRVFGNDQ